MSNTIRVLTKKPGMVNRLTETNMEKGLANMQALVAPLSGDDGRNMIECVYIPELAEHRIDLWVNEEGKFNGCRPNFQIFNGQDIVMGPVFFASNDDEGDTVSLSDEQVAVVRAWLARQPMSVF
jgi:hypothetical protein